jgi:hypothetical protein
LMTSDRWHGPLGSILSGLPSQLDRSGVFGADWPAGRLEHRKVKCYIIYCVEHMLW